jgi:hypothetical protein
MGTRVPNLSQQCRPVCPALSMDAISNAPTEFFQLKLSN